MRYYLQVCCLFVLLLCLFPRVEAQQQCDTLITIYRSGCLGDCPSYSAQIYADGTVVDVGPAFVKTTGERRFTISPQAVQNLIKEFQRLDYWSLKDRYDVDEKGNSVLDVPITTTSICLNGKKKQVVNLYGPKRLDELEDRIDSLGALYSLLGPL